MRRFNVTVFGHLIDEANLQMVVQILPDAGKLVHDGHAAGLQQWPGPDAGELQDLW